MTIENQIQQFIAGQPGPKQADLRQLHHTLLRLMPGCRLWFLNGKDESGKTVSNPSIGYGFVRLQQARGKGRDFYQVGISPNTGGLSVYLFGIDDRKALAERFAQALGKASVTGYCIKFKTLKDVDMSVLEAALRFAIEQSGGVR